MVFLRRWFFPLLLLFILAVASRTMAVQGNPSPPIGLRTVVEPTRAETAVLPTQASLSPGEAVDQRGTVIPRGLNVRLGAGSEFGVIAAVKQGTELELLGQDQTGRWLKVGLPTGEKGWVGASFVARPDAAVRLPVVVNEQVLVTATQPSVVPAVGTATSVPIVIATAESDKVATATSAPAQVLSPTSTATQTALPTNTATVAPTNTVAATATPAATATTAATQTSVPTSTATVAPTNTATAVATNAVVGEETAVVPPTATPLAIAQAIDPTIPTAAPSDFTPPSDSFSIIKVFGTVFLVIAFLFTIIIFLRLNQRRI